MDDLYELEDELVEERNPYPCFLRLAEQSENHFHIPYTFRGGELRCGDETIRFFREEMSKRQARWVSNISCDIICLS